MDRTFQRFGSRTLLASIGVGCLASTGCIHTILATAIYLRHGGNTVPAEYAGLEKERVVVLVRPPASHEYRNAGAARNLGLRVGAKLEQNVKGIELVSAKEVDNWVDEQDWENFKDLGHAVKADRVVYIELDDFELYKGKTLYQGAAEINVSVYDMNDNDRLVWDRRLGQVLFPKNSGIPASDMPPQAFEQRFIEIVARQIAEHFYKHDPNANYALDAVANH